NVLLLLEFRLNSSTELLQEEIQLFEKQSNLQKTIKTKLGKIYPSSIFPTKMSLSESQPQEQLPTLSEDWKNATKTISSQAVLPATREVRFRKRLNFRLWLL